VGKADVRCVVKELGTLPRLKGAALDFKSEGRGKARPWRQIAVPFFSVAKSDADYSGALG